MRGDGPARARARSTSARPRRRAAGSRPVPRRRRRLPRRCTVETGRTATIQGLLDRMNVLFTGSGAEASRLAFSKSASKERFFQTGVPTPPYVLVHESDDLQRMPRAGRSHRLSARRQTRLAGFEPGREHRQITQAISAAGPFRNASSYDSSALLEQAIPGTEWTVRPARRRAAAADPNRNAARILRLHGEVRGLGHDSCRFEFAGAGRAASSIVEAGCRAARAIGTRGLARVDCGWTSGAAPGCSKSTRFPDLTDHSLVPKRPLAPASAWASCVNGPSNARSWRRLAVGRRFPRTPSVNGMAASGKKGLKDSDSDVLIRGRGRHELPRALDSSRPSIVLAVIACIAAYFLFPGPWSGCPTCRIAANTCSSRTTFTSPTRPPGCRRTFLKQVAREGGLPDELSMLDDEARRQRGGRVPESMPWVDRVVSVQKEFPQRVTVVARVPQAGRLRRHAHSERYAVDKHAVLLPPPDLPPAERRISADLQRPLDAAGTEAGQQLARPHDRRRRQASPTRSARRGKSCSSRRFEIPEPAGRRPAGRRRSTPCEPRGARGSSGAAPRAATTPANCRPNKRSAAWKNTWPAKAASPTRKARYEIDIRHWKEITSRPLGDDGTRTRE